MALGHQMILLEFDDTASCGGMGSSVKVKLSSLILFYFELIKQSIALKEFFLFLSYFDRL